MILFDESGYRIEKMEKDQLRDMITPLISRVHNEYSSFDTSGLNPLPDKVEKLDSNKNSLFSLNLGLFHKEDLVGWSYGTQTHDNRYYMKNSGIVPEHRGKGLYTKMLSIVLAETKKEGLLEVFSNHHADNNRILINKLKHDFFITGFEILPKFGLTVCLTYCHSEEIKKMFGHRTGRSLDGMVKERYRD